MSVNYSEKTLRRMSRRQIFEAAFDICSERDLCKERGGFQSKEIMIANFLKRQNEITPGGSFCATWSNEGKRIRVFIPD